MELARADLWEIYFALHKRIGFYMEQKSNALEYDDFESSHLADLRLVALKTAEEKIWAELEKNF